MFSYRQTYTCVARRVPPGSQCWQRRCVRLWPSIWQRRSTSLPNTKTPGLSIRLCGISPSAVSCLALGTRNRRSTCTVPWQRTKWRGTNWSRCVPSSHSVNISVDEAMIRFDGRLSCKQYMPKKPVKWGIKMWCLCDANTGYCIAFNVYTGRNEGQAVNLDLGYKVVMRLMCNYLQRHHHVYADNFFTSVHLAEALLQADTYLCGTTRATRKEFPKALAKAVLLGRVILDFAAYG